MQALAQTLYQIKFPSLSISEWNKKGILTGILLMLLGVSVLIYLISLYTSFFFGLNIQKTGKTIQDLEKKVTGQEVALQRKIDSLAKDENLLGTMEKVSAVKYLKREGIAVNTLSSQP